MKHRKRNQFVALTLAATMLMPVNVFADLKRDIYVGDVVSISARDLQVKGNYKSLSEVNKEYVKDTGGVTSNNTSIDASDGKHLTGSGNSLINSFITDEDLSGTLPNKTKKTFTYEEFEKLIKDQDSKVKKEYEKAKKKAQDAQKEAQKKGAEKIKKAIENAENGKNPVTGEAINEGDNFYEDMKKAGQDFLDWVKNTVNNNDSSDNQGSFGDDPMQNSYDDALHYTQEMYQLYAEQGNQDEIKDLHRIDESEYVNDTLVYEKDKKNYQDIKYKCATCGKTYGFNQFCDCGKIFANKVQKHFYDNKSVFEQYFSSFDKNGNAKTGNLWSSKMKCALCGKELTIKNIEPQNLNNKELGFAMGSNGMIMCKECRNGNTKDNVTTYDDSSNWSTYNPYWDNFIIPVKSDTMGKKKGDASDAKTFRDFLSDEEKKYYDDMMEKIKNGYPNSDTQAKFLDDFVKKYQEYLGEITKIPSGSSSTWTEKEKKNMRDAIKQLENNGVPPAETYGKDIKKIKDTDDYKDNVNKIFKEWPADKEEWTKGQKELYEKTKQEMENDSAVKKALDDIVDKGIISKDKTYEEIKKGLDDYIAGFTTIDEKVTVNVTVDSVGKETYGKKKKFTVQGDALLSLVDPDGSTVVSDYQITESLGYRFCPDHAGKYTFKRKVRIYDIEWRTVYQTYNIKAEAEMPGGSTILLYEKQITRLREDKSGLKSSNMRELSAPNITVNVKPRTLDIDKKDFFDTERIS